VAAFSRVIDKIRNSEYRKAAKENKDVFKGAKYLLLKKISAFEKPIKYSSKEAASAAQTALGTKRGNQHRNDPKGPA